jgi:hypothetical protein
MNFFYVFKELDFCSLLIESNLLRFQCRDNNFQMYCMILILFIYYQLLMQKNKILYKQIKKKLIIVL